ncbi:hypothetical protein DY000_02026812 [Brassica cretica]|uniref:Uncharacterized protein n=1 Tax=Brassica cretica TaxID=69181 RepID=A0ABQ7E856_BRACR|nr:hypothetical protein DY000_02026812 [Brassica cretica]
MDGVLVMSLKFCIVDLVIEMVKNRKVKDMNIKIKYTCLAITILHCDVYGRESPL